MIGGEEKEGAMLLFVTASPRSAPLEALGPQTFKTLAGASEDDEDDWEDDDRSDAERGGQPTDRARACARRMCVCGVCAPAASLISSVQECMMASSCPPPPSRPYHQGFP